MLRRIALGTVSLALAAAVLAAGQAPIPDAVRTAAAAITAEQLRQDVHVLAADALRGRATATAGFDSAAAYITRRLAQLGLRPLGDGGTYRQHYSVREAVLDTVATTLSLAGRPLRYGADFLVLLFTDSGTVTAPIVYAGHGVRALHKGIDPYAGLDVRGTFVLVHGPGVLPKGETFPSLGRVRTDWQPAQDAARSLGAVGLIYIVPPAQQARWDRIRATGLGTARELDPPVPSAYARPRLPVLMLQASVLDSLLAGEPTSAAALMAGAATQDYAPSFALSATKTVQLRVAFASATVRRPYNVVAQLDGADPTLRREAVVVLAHLDGAVGTGGVGGDSIYNAADDNASGSSGVLGIAAALVRAPRPKRSVIFLWDSGEEVGLWGSRFFVTQPPVPLVDMITLINVDMIGRARVPGTNNEDEAELTGPDETYVVGPGVLSTALDSLVTRANAAYLQLTLNRRYDVATNQFFYPRTDAGPFLERGVLTLGYFTGLHGDYHGVGDGPERLDPAKMERIARTVFVTTWLLADAAQRPAIDKGIPRDVPRY
jgi:hypothetical protein